LPSLIIKKRIICPCLMDAQIANNLVSSMILLALSYKENQRLISFSHHCNYRIKKLFD